MENLRNGMSECREQRLWDAAAKVALSEYEGEMLYYGDEYFYDEQELIEKIAENDWCEQGCPDDFDDSKYTYPDAFPKMGVYGCERLPIELDAYEIIGLLEESDVAYESYRIDDKAAREIVDFCESWNKKHAEHVYWPDFAVGIVADGGDGR
ncbi:MAG: hypothetical protein IJ087_04605 [Eggerthellaceae bacterium]|nr:hypothetical protein [Eggerthellaceae bacterium]